MLFTKKEPIELVRIFTGTGKNNKPYSRIKVGDPKNYDTIEAFLSLRKDQDAADFIEGQSYLASVKVRPDGKISVLLDTVTSAPVKTNIKISQ